MTRGSNVCLGEQDMTGGSNVLLWVVGYGL